MQMTFAVYGLTLYHNFSLCLETENGTSSLQSELSSHVLDQCWHSWIAKPAGEYVFVF